MIGFKGKLEIQVAKEIKAIGYRTIITEEDRMEEGGGGIITEIEIKSEETKIEMRYTSIIIEVVVIMTIQYLLGNKICVRSF